VSVSAEPDFPAAKSAWWYVVVIVVVVVAVLGLLLCRGCLSGVSTCTTCPPSSLPPEPMCPAPTEDVAHNDMPPNGLTPGFLADLQDMPPNGVPPGALNGRAPNLRLLQQLAANRLTQDLFTRTGPAAWQELLVGDHAPELIKYIVSCALDANERVDIPAWPELATMRRQLACGFPGEIGLCSQRYLRQSKKPGASKETIWSAEPATRGCQERVSACVLARVNALGARVPISLRGDGTALLDKVPVQTQFRENHGTPIRSFQRCDQMCLWGDPLRRNCDWERRHVGQCTRGADDGPRKVRLEVGSSVALRVRICTGIYGCDDTAPGLGAGSATAPVLFQGHLVEFPAHYGGQMLHQGTANHTIEFDCTDNGPRVEIGDRPFRTGYYSVMLGTLEPGVAVPDNAIIKLVRQPDDPVGPSDAEPPHDSYPAPERKVFTFREGGFFGTIFPGRELAAATTSSKRAPVPNEKFACASEIWDIQAAQEAARLCAGPMGSVLPGGCFGNAPGRCDVAGDPQGCVTPADAGPPQVYDACRSLPDAATSAVTRAPLWDYPYTTYLNHPCDLFTTDEECARFIADPRNLVIRTAPSRADNNKTDKRESDKDKSDVYKRDENIDRDRRPSR